MNLLTTSKSLQKTRQKKPLNLKKDGSKTPLYSIIIPTYNEAKNIKRLVSTLRKLYPEAEIVVVDDNSPDETAKIVSKIAEKDRLIRLVKREGKLGLSSAIIDGVKAASTPFFIVCDADFSHPPQKIGILIKHVLGGEDIVIGSRYCKGGGIINWPFTRRWVSLWATLMAKIKLFTLKKTFKTTDPMSGFFASKKEILTQNLSLIEPKGYKILFDLLQGYNGTSIIEVPYTFQNRSKGKSKLSAKEIMLFAKTSVK